VLGWEAQMSFEELIAAMVETDLRELAAAVR
jgi:GDP-D-mannose dehydratase